jgi:hypothetical protein
MAKGQSGKKGPRGRSKAAPRELKRAKRPPARRPVSDEARARKAAIRLGVMATRAADFPDFYATYRGLVHKVDPASGKPTPKSADTVRGHLVDLSNLTAANIGTYLDGLFHDGGGDPVTDIELSADVQAPEEATLFGKTGDYQTYREVFPAHLAGQKQHAVGVMGPDDLLAFYQAIFRDPNAQAQGGVWDFHANLQKYDSGKMTLDELANWMAGVAGTNFTVEATQLDPFKEIFLKEGFKQIRPYASYPTVPGQIIPYAY